MKEQNCMSHFFHRRSGSAAVFSFSVMSRRRGSIRRPRNGKIVSYDKDSTMKVLNRLFIVVTVTGLATMLAAVSAHAARNLAVDDKGNLFVADTDSASILKFTSDGKRSTFASGLNDANDMAFDDKGNLFVRDGNTIFKFTPAGVKSTFASGIVPETYDPYHVAEVFTGLAPDRSGNIFVAEHVSGSILKFTPDGKKSTFASGVSPYKMVVDGAGNLFVTQEVSSNLFVTREVSPSILRFTHEGKKTTLASGVSPDKMAGDGAGNLFAADANTIFKFTPDGKKKIGRASCRERV